MANKLFEIIVASVTASNYDELCRPVLSNIKEYKYDIEAASAEKAEDLAIEKLVNDENLFDKQTQFAVVVETKMKDGTPVVYAKNDQYRKLARELRKFRMWPYLERCKEMTRDYCVYKGVSVEEAAKYIAADPGICSSPNRDIQGNELNVVQQIYAKVHKENAIRYENALNAEKSSKTENNNNAKQEPLYPDAGLERYHQANPEVTKELARQSKPESVVSIAQEEPEVSNNVTNIPVKSLKETLENITGNTVEETHNSIIDANNQYLKDDIIINKVKCRIWLSKSQNIEGMILSDDETKKFLSFKWGINSKTGRYYDSPAVFGAAGQLTYRGKRAFDTKTKEWTTLYSKEELRNLEVVKSVKEKLVAILNSVD